MSTTTKVTETTQPENKVCNAIICVSCLSFFPVMYLIGSTLVAFLH
ncbi:MAG: hypothetical protein KDC24_06575 [Saprospiraceae bacterium]|nr:hypothetical protein [Saprospiraceae bacterium]